MNRPNPKTKERIRRIKEYREKHPLMTTRAIGKIFRVSHVTVVRALNGKEGGK